MRTIAFLVRIARYSVKVRVGNPASRWTGDSLTGKPRPTSTSGAKSKNLSFHMQNAHRVPGRQPCSGERKARWDRVCPQLDANGIRVPLGPACRSRTEIRRPDRQLMSQALDDARAVQALLCGP